MRLLQNPSPAEILASVFFGLAVLHTFSVKRFAHWAHRFRPGSVQENVLHFLAETEVVFGLWAAALFLGVTAMNRSVSSAVAYIEGLNFTEPKFVLVVMVVAATRPMVTLGSLQAYWLKPLIQNLNGDALFFGAVGLTALTDNAGSDPVTRIKNRIANSGGTGLQSVQFDRLTVCYAIVLKIFAGLFSKRRLPLCSWLRRAPERTPILLSSSKS